MRKIIIAATIVSLGAPLVPAAAVQSGWSGHDRSSVGYTVRAATMRAGPDRDYPPVRKIPKNRRVEVFGCLNDWSWCDVGYRRDRGWVAAHLLSADYRGRRQRFDSVAPYIGIGVLAFMFGTYWDNHYRGRPFYSERNRWERHYNDAYRPQWGPRPSVPPAGHAPDRQPPRPGQHGAAEPHQDRQVAVPPPARVDQRPVVVPNRRPVTARPDVSRPAQNRTIRTPANDRHAPTARPARPAKPDRPNDDDKQHNTMSRH